MKHLSSILISAIFIFSFVNLKAADGDTTTIRTHDGEHWNWYMNIDKWAVFPDASNSFQKILLNYTWGCPSIGCSEWDYSTKIEILHRTGEIDSTSQTSPMFTVDGNELDTLTYNVDSTWTYFYNSTTQTTDSTANVSMMVYLYGNSSDPLSLTDSMVVFPSGYWNYMYDSSAVIIDSVYSSPDSVWVLGYHSFYVPFDVVEIIEVARAITPYAGNRAAGWEYTMSYDLTDYAPILRDSVEVRAFYGGWQDGFLITLDFIMIEGTPPRNPISVQNVYHSGAGGYPYGITSNPIENYLVPVNIPIPSNAAEARLSVTHSGHSFGGNLNCAEFCAKNYYINVNGNQEFQQLVWKDDCGSNPLFPQTGTWIYDRANWCPGDRAIARNHELTSFITPGQDVTIDMNMDSYTYSGGASFDPNYIIDAHVITFGSKNFNNDATIFDVLAPSNKGIHSRHNPICNNPKIVLQNKGASTLTSAKITYGPIGGTDQTFDWTGSLGFMDTVTVYLPSTNFQMFNGATTGKFTASVSNPNGTTDENPSNDIYTSTYNIPTVMPNEMYLWLKTNNAANETTWDIRNDHGTVLYQNGTLSNATNYNSPIPPNVIQDTLRFDPGCYTLTLYDSGCDGLYFFANNDGSGTAKLMGFPSSTLYTFNADFGCRSVYTFTVGYTTEISELQGSHQLEVYPNPVLDVLNIEVIELKAEKRWFEMIDITGKLVLTGTLNQESAFNEKINVEHLSSGLYKILVHSDDRVMSKSFVVGK